MAELLVRKGRLPEAIDVLQEALLLYAYYTPYYRLLAVCYMNTGSQRRVSDILQKGLQQAPESQVLRQLLDKVTRPASP